MLNAQIFIKLKDVTCQIMSHMFMLTSGFPFGIRKGLNINLNQTPPLYLDLSVEAESDSLFV